VDLEEGVQFPLRILVSLSSDGRALRGAPCECVGSSPTRNNQLVESVLVSPYQIIHL